MRGTVGGWRRGGSRVGRRRAVVLVVTVLVGLAWGRVEAADETFMGVPVVALSGDYMVSTDVNVRAGPRTDSKRIGRLAEGERVQVVGRPKDAAWLAVRKEGRDLGFVYAPVLIPLIDGALDGDLEGEAAAKDIDCRYRVVFAGRNPAEGEVFEIADYEVDFRCERGGRPLDFAAYMFITEGPYKAGKRNLHVHQVTVDLPQVENGYDEVFSTNFLYRRDQGQLIFDGVTLKGYGAPPATRERAVSSIEEALRGAVEMAVETWTAKLWEALAKGDG